MQQQFEQSSLFPGESESSTRPGVFARTARALAARFVRGAVDPVEQPFRDSDFEAESDFFGRPLGEH
ncbi:hypothetical protein ACPWT1_21840 [Ramlibacter sp. MMS24-I3-19]|uniref:hypothetical protein n=1 Tax=Ramlibacter sp. MMS24-I3-19 TaxID=3416606 RepID=UPI003D087BA3